MTGGGSVYQGETLLIAAGSSDEQSADVVFHPASGWYLVVWEDSAGGNWDVRSRLVLPDGSLDGSSYPIADGSQDERYPRIAADPAGGGMVVWQGYEGGDGAFDLHGRQLWADGDSPANSGASQWGPALRWWKTMKSAQPAGSKASSTAAAVPRRR